MKIGSTTLIPQNVAPENAKKVVLFDSNDNKVIEIALGHLAIPNLGAKKYSAGLLSDTHTNTYSNAQDSYDDLARAIGWMSSNAEMTYVSGDLANLRYDYDDGLQKYKEIVGANKGDMEVYAIPGNHEHWDSNAKVIPLSDGEIKAYTGYPLYYTVTNQPTDEANRNYYNPTVGNDVFIMCGYIGSQQFNATTIQWLYETLEANRNKRCFLFVHAPIDDAQHCGDALNVITWDGIGSYKTVFVSLLKHYRNVTWFHGHSHAMLEMQDYLQGLPSPLPANYDFTDGVHSVHIPATAVSRDISSGSREDVVATSQGYLMDVYENHIVLKGRDFVKGEFIPIATYCLNTKLVEIPAGTFTDSTGTIVT
jgi:hypothetical protein